ncbi:MAG: hypothetical protein NXI07_15245, partial [bacterium]|nr:hypothetical protein [bacterium]
MIDLATKFAILVMIPDGSSKTAARFFTERWCSWAGQPEGVVVDNKTEFKRHFSDLNSNLGTNLRIIPTKSPWMHGVTERHGSVIVDIVTALVHEFSINSKEDLSLACAVASMAKNRRPDAFVVSPRARVFGSGERLPGSVIESWLGGERFPEFAVHDAARKDADLQRSFK